MFNNYNANLVLTLLKKDGKGEDKATRVTLGNVRRDLTAQEVKQIAEAFRSLIKHPLVDIELVQFHRIIWGD